MIDLKKRLSASAAYALLGVALFYLLEYLVLAGLRLPYPYELEWEEGAIVDHVRRLFSGTALYAEPSFEFTALLYPPLFYYLSYWICKVIGVSFFSLRLLSFAASIGSLILIYRFVQRETGRVFYGLLAAGFYTALFERGGAWIDVARVDSLFVLLLLLSAYTFRFFPSAGGACAAGTLFAFAAVTKQPALFVTVFIGIACLNTYGLHRFMVFFAGFALPFCGFTALHHYLSDGWYSYYVFKLPSQHGFFSAMLGLFWTRDLLQPLPIACIFLLLYFCLHLFDWKKLGSEERSKLAFYTLFFLSMLIASWSSRLHFGGASNVLLPVYAAFATLWGIGLHRLLSSPIYQTSSRLSPFRYIWLRDYLIYTLAIAQFGWLFYDPRKYLPTADDRAAGDAFIKVLSSIEGEVYTPDHGFLPTLAGKRTYTHTAVLWDIMRADDNAIKHKLEDEIEQVFKNHRFAAVIIQNPALTFPWIIDRVNKYYRNRGGVLEGKMLFGQINFCEIPQKLNPQIFRPRR